MKNLNRYMEARQCCSPLKSRSHDDEVRSSKHESGTHNFCHSAQFCCLTELKFFIELVWSDRNLNTV